MKSKAGCAKLDDHDVPSASSSPPSMNSLNDDTMKHIFGFVGVGHFAFLANVDSRFHKTYKLFVQQQHQDTNRVVTCFTATKKVAESLERVKFAWNMWEKDDDFNPEGWLEWYLEVRDIVLGLLTGLAANGNLPALQWIWHRNRIYRNLFSQIYILEHAVIHGHFHIIQWCFQQHNLRPHSLCRLAALHGQLHIIQWARRNGFPWNEDACSEAATGGNLQVLIWLRENGCPWNEETMQWSARYGHLELLQWAYSNDCPRPNDLMGYAVLGEHQEIVQWAIRNGFNGEATISATAAGFGNPDVLRALRESGCPWDEETCECAALDGNLSCLQWARENGCPWDERTCEAAARVG